MSWVNWDGWVTFLFRSWRLSVVNSKCVSISCMCHCLLIVFVFVLSCQVMSPHHSNQMSPRSQVYRIALWRCSLNVIVFLFVFYIVFVFLLVRSCFLITLIKCLKGHRSLGSLFVCQNQKVAHSVSQWVSDNVTYWAVRWQLKNNLYLMLLIWSDLLAF